MPIFSLKAALFKVCAYSAAKTRPSEQLLQIEIIVRSASEAMKLFVSVDRFSSTGNTDSMCASVSLGASSQKAMLSVIHAFFDT